MAKRVKAETSDEKVERLFLEIEAKKGRYHTPVESEVAEGEEVWEQMKREPKKAYVAFATYRDLGAKRRMYDAARELGYLHKKLDSKGNPVPNAALLYRWAKEYRWNARIDAYDKWLDKVKLAKAKEEAEKMVERHLTIAATVQSKAHKRLREMDDQELKDRMGPNAILKYLVEGIKIERQTRGEPTVIVKSSGGPVPASADELEDETAAAARAMLIDKINAIAKRRSVSMETPVTEQKTKDISNRIRHIDVIAESN